LEAPPRWPEAKAAADLALAVDPKHVKALYRRAQATLEDEREGLPEASLRAALDDLRAAQEVDPSNMQVKAEVERVGRRIAVLEASRSVPEPGHIARRIPGALLSRGSDLLAERGYLWGQSESMVHIFVPALGMRLGKATAASCEVRARSLNIVVPRPEGQPPLELAGALHRPVCADDCSWQLEEGGWLLHVELVKQDQSKLGEHWHCVWQGHPRTLAPSAEEQGEVEGIARAACMADASEATGQKKHPAADETVRRLREMCPGVSIEWGDTSLDGFG